MKRAGDPAGQANLACLLPRRLSYAQKTTCSTAYGAQDIAPYWQKGLAKECATTREVKH